MPRLSFDFCLVFPFSFHNRIELPVCRLWKPKPRTADQDIKYPEMSLRRDSGHPWIRISTKLPDQVSFPSLQLSLLRQRSHSLYSCLPWSKEPGEPVSYLTIQLKRPFYLFSQWQLHFLTGHSAVCSLAGSAHSAQKIADNYFFSRMFLLLPFVFKYMFSNIIFLT